MNMPDQPWTTLDDLPGELVQTLQRLMIELEAADRLAAIATSQARRGYQVSSIIINLPGGIFRAQAFKEADHELSEIQYALQTARRAMQELGLK
jgi:hypothetical protein